MIIIKVSVIVPVHDGQKYLERAILSLLNQTLEYLEVIIVNDGNTDTTASIADRFAASDKRVRVIHLEKNIGLYEARLMGLESASGEYIASCNANDYYSIDAMEKMYNKAKESDADIVQGKTLCLYADGKSEESWFTRTPHERLEKSDILKNILESGNNWSMCGKIIRRYVFLQCLNEYPRGKHLVYTEDLMIFAPIAYYSNLEIFINDGVYFYDRTSETIGTLRGYDIVKDKKRVTDTIEISISLCNFIREKSPSMYGDFVRVVQKFFSCIFDKFKYSDSQKYELFQIWFDNMSPDTIPPSFFYFDEEKNEEKLSPRLLKHLLPKNSIVKTKVIGMHCGSLTQGGAERVMSVLAFLFLERGYKIVIFTDVEESNKDYDLPNGVPRIVIGHNDTVKRFQLWQSSIEKYSIDTIIQHGTWDEQVKYDTLFFKKFGVRTIGISHNVFAAHIYLNIMPWYYKYMQWFSLFDAFVCLSNIDACFWNMQKITNVQYIPNPLTFKIDNSRMSKLNGKTVLWIGRFDNNVKQITLALDTFALVLNKIPDAKFLILGTGTDEQNKVAFNKCRKLNIEFACEFVGFETDVMPYILRSDVHIMTSIFEGFPMVLGEVKSCGVPTAMFDLPYLEMTKDGLGVVKVPRGDVESLACAIIKILSNSEYKKQLGREAFESLQPFIDYDIISAWERLFESINNPKPQQSIDKNTLLVVEELLRAAVSLNEKYRKIEQENNLFKDTCANFLGIDSKFYIEDNKLETKRLSLFYNSIMPYFFSIIRDSKYLTIRIFGIKVTVKNKKSSGRMFIITNSQILRAIFSIKTEEQKYIVLRLLGFKISIKLNFRQRKNEYNKS